MTITTKLSPRERSIADAKADPMHGVTWIWDDGGRHEAGFEGIVGDCVARSVAIASGRPYREIYDRLAQGNATQRRCKRESVSAARTGRATASHGIFTRRKWFSDYMTELGAAWVPTMAIGAGCKVHLSARELPPGRLVVNVSKHLTAVIDGVIRDLHDPSRGGTRCVYGYWVFPDTPDKKATRPPYAVKRPKA
jgi:hypothetical protein